MDLYIIQAWKKGTFSMYGILGLNTENPQKDHLKNMDGNWNFFRCDHQLRKLVIAKQILLVRTLAKVYRTVYRDLCNY